jgi:hypothetical protein
MSYPLERVSSPQTVTVCITDHSLAGPSSSSKGKSVDRVGSQGQDSRKGHLVHSRKRDRRAMEEEDEEYNPSNRLAPGVRPSHSRRRPKPTPVVKKDAPTGARVTPPLGMDVSEETVYKPGELPSV